MIASAIVTIVLNGAIVPSFAPARISFGHVVGPLAPVVTRFASRVVYVPGDGTVVIERAAHRIIVPVRLFEGDVPYVALAPVIRGLGGSATFDARTKTMTILLADERPIESPAPFDRRAPQVAPTSVFTPEPPRATPRAIDTGSPMPRRTAIPATPSQPQIRP